MSSKYLKVIQTVIYQTLWTYIIEKRLIVSLEQIWVGYFSYFTIQTKHYQSTLTTKEV